MHEYLVATGRKSIAEAASKYQSTLLSADKGAEYDQLVEIDLNTLVPHVNGPFTPDLAHPINMLGEHVCTSNHCWLLFY